MNIFQIASLNFEFSSLCYISHISSELLHWKQILLGEFERLHLNVSTVHKLKNNLFSIIWHLYSLLFLNSENSSVTFACSKKFCICSENKILANISEKIGYLIFKNNYPKVYEPCSREFLYSLSITNNLTNSKIFI